LHLIQVLMELLVRM